MKMKYFIFGILIFSLVFVCFPVQSFACSCSLAQNNHDNLKEQKLYEEEVSEESIEEDDENDEQVAFLKERKQKKHKKKKGKDVILELD